MFEKRSQPLLPPSQFVIRLIKSVIFGLIVIAIALTIGTFGYHFFEDLPWIDAFMSAAMILSGMGSITPLQTIGGKLFASFYAIFSGLAFILIVGIIFAPAVHRVLHIFHLPEEGEEKTVKRRPPSKKKK